MKRLSTYLSIAVITVAAFAVQQAFTYSSGPIDGVTGAPGESNCTQCHTGNAVNSGPSTLHIEVSGQTLTSYVPGETYTMHVFFTNDSRANNGFECTVVGSGGENGTLAVTDQTNTQISASSGRQYVKHTTAGHINRQSWEFAWTAPAAGSGSVTFYSAGNSTNNSGTNQGDLIYTTSFTLEEGTATAVKPSAIEAGSLSVFPNPAAGSAEVSFGLKRTSAASLALYDLLGRKVLSKGLGQVEAGSQTHKLDIPSDVKAGVYILRLEAEGKSSATRMNVL